jgi:hypothetical protein
VEDGWKHRIYKSSSQFSSGIYICIHVNVALNPSSLLHYWLIVLSIIRSKVTVLVST